MFVSVTRGIFVLCHHIIVNLFVRKPELNGANLPNFDLNSCHFCPSFFCPPTVHELFPKNVTSSQMALLLSKSALIADECFSSQGQQKRQLISEIYGN
jgi:hypothetical protein